MLRGIFALFFRSLRGDARSIGVHLSWLFLLIVIYVALWFAQEQSRFVGAPGRDFFRNVIYLDAIFLTLLGVSYFSSAISEEKEEDTLGLMTMAGISPLGILLGKSTTRLFQVILLLAVQYPFTLLALTLGGLMPDQIYAAYAALFAYTLMLANAGLLCSVVCRRNRDASGLTTLWLISYLFIPLFALAGHEFLKSPPIGVAVHPFFIRHEHALKSILLWISQSSVFGQLYWVTETGYRLEMTPQLISNSLGGFLFFLLSWWLFQFVSHDPAPESTTRALVPRKTGRLRWLGAGRVWNFALSWKDFHFVTGGWFGIVMRCGLYVGMYWLVYTASYPWYDTTFLRQVAWRDVTMGYQSFLVPLFAVDCGLVASRIFHDEIRHQTLASLMMLPRSVPYLVYTKIAGCLTGLLPGVIALFWAFFLLDDATRLLSECLKEPPLWWYVANLLFAIHLCAATSLYLRWGTFAISIAAVVGSMILTVMCMSVMRIANGNNAEIMLGLFVVPLLLGCAMCHFTVLFRIPFLAEK